MSEPTRSPVTLLRRMSGRDPDEEHRASTPLELLFDLTFVVAVARAASGLKQALEQGHAVLTLPVSIVIMAALGVLLLAYHLAAAPQAARQPGQAAP
jgi:low temperature requirement protein LtrA